MGVHCYTSPCSAAYPRARPRSTTVRRHPHIGAGTTTRGLRRTNESRHPPAHFIAFIAFGAAAALARVFTRFIAFIAFGAAAALARMFTRFIAFMAFGAAVLAMMLTRFIAFMAFGAAALARTVTRFIAFIAFIAFAMTSRKRESELEGREIQDS